MNYQEVKKQLQALQKRAHNEAKDLPEPYEIICEISERISRNGAWYVYRLAIYDDKEQKTIKSSSGYIYQFFTDEQNMAEFNKRTTDFFASVEELKNENN